MADEIYIKHNLGPFQQPYIFQQPGIGQQPAIGNTRYPFIGSTRQPNIYQFRTPQTYQAQGNTQQPNIRDGQEPNIRNAQEPNIGNSQEPNIRNAQEPNIRDGQEPNIRDAQQPNIRQTPAPYPYIASSQVPNIGNTRQPNTYTFPSTYNIQTPANYQTPFTYDIQTTGNTQQPNIRQQPGPYPFITTYNIQTSVNYQTPFTYPYIASGRNPLIYSYRSPANGNAQESLYFTATTGDIDLLVSSAEQSDSFSGSTTIIEGGPAELHLYVQSSGNTMSLYARGENTNDEFRYLKRESGTTQNISTGAGTLIATYTFTAGYHPSQFRFVIAGIANTQTRFVSGSVVDGAIDNVNSTTAINHYINYYSTPYATSNFSSNVVSSTSASGGFTNYSSSLNGGFELRYSGQASWVNGTGSFSTEGSQSWEKQFNLSLQFTRNNSTTLTTSAPLTMKLVSNSDYADEGEGDEPGA